MKDWYKFPNRPTPAVAAELGLGTMHLSALELRLARRLEVSEADVVIHGPPIAAIVGEAPGPNTSPKLPLFPLPPRSAGARLMSYSRISPARYLGAFLRRNLFRELPRAWDRNDACVNAEQLSAELRLRGITRVILLGTKVGAAFDVPDLWSHGHAIGFELVTIPHPSGRCRIYNDIAAQRRAGAMLRWAARLRKNRP